MIWEISKFIAIHHVGVSSTNYALEYLGFDSKSCEIAARNFWCFLFSIFFTYCGIFWYIHKLRQGLLGYFLSDLALIFRIKQFNTLETWMHHVLGITLVCMGMVDASYYRQYATITFGGIGEFSNVLLSITDTFKNIPKLQKRYPTINTVAQILFGLSFISLRVGLYTYTFIRHRASANIVEYYTTLAFILLQYYWFYIILRRLLRKCLKKNTS